MYRPYHLISILFIAILSIALYANTLKNGFVYDDDEIIVKNALIKNLYNIPSLFAKDYFELSGEQSYRPVVTLTYFLDQAIYGLKPWGFHLTNILLHAANGALLYIFLILLTSPPDINSRQPIIVRLPDNPSLLVSLLFVAHPALTEAVNAISFREDLLAFLFCIATLAIYLFLRNGRLSLSYYLLFIISCLLYFLALLSKEIAITLPLIIYCYEWTYKGKKSHRSILFNLYNIGYIAVTGVYIYLRFFYFKNPVEEVSFYPGDLIGRLLSIPWLLLSYLKLSVFPIALSVDYVTAAGKSLFSPFLIVPSIIAVTLIVNILRKGIKAITFGILFFAITLIPVYNIIPISNPMAERYLYLPMAGLAIAGGHAIYCICKTHTLIVRTCVLISFLTIVSIYSILTVKRNEVWRDSYSLWTDTIEKMPNSSRAHFNLGFAYDRQGRLDSAALEYKIAIKLKPNKPEYHFNLANLYHKQKHFDEAVQEYKTALRLNSDNPEYHNNLGLVYATQGKIGEALSQFQAALRFRPNDSRLHYNLGLLYSDREGDDKAISHFREAIRLNPGFLEARNNLGVIYSQLRRFDDAIEQYQTLLRLNPRSIEGHHNLGVAYLNKGLKDAARVEFELALKLKPDFSPSRHALKSLK